MNIRVLLTRSANPHFWLLINVEYVHCVSEYIQCVSQWMHIIVYLSNGKFERRANYKEAKFRDANTHIKFFLSVL